VSQLDQMTQQNAALVEQSAAAAQSLREQAARLAETVQVFRVDVTLSGEPIALTSSPVAPPPAQAAHAAPPLPAKPAAVQRVAPPAREPSPRARVAPATSGEGEWETF
jgi:methyl-accepting chemotaxis protein